ncbi:hypothetical protein SDC9_200276 [bioreactor metagenome]|uniref:Uncharacterized protein n=1 Tax=bioreactor metagenome TaxID=1076179 RepID=A0A645IW43_9ZZZZ
MITANTVPNTTIHQGASGGILTASSNPVSNAELSFKIGTMGCLRSLSTPASAAIALMAARIIWNNVPQPKNHSCAAIPGNAASNTNIMIRDVWRWLWV